VFSHSGEQSGKQVEKQKVPEISDLREYHDMYKCKKNFLKVFPNNQ